MQFGLLFYRSALQPGLEGEKGIPTVHLTYCCIRWSACMMSPSRSIMDLPDCISVAWANVFGNLKVLILDGGTGMRSNEADDWAMYSQAALKHKAFHQKAWLVERHNAFIRSALQGAETHAIKESLRVSLVTVLGLVTFRRNASVCRQPCSTPSVARKTTQSISTFRRWLPRGVVD